MHQKWRPQKGKTRPARASPDILGVCDTHRVKQWKALWFPAVAQITDPSSQTQPWAQGKEQPWQCNLKAGKTIMCWAKSLSRVWLFATPWTAAHQALLCLWVSPGKNTGVGCQALLQGIFPTQGSNPWLLHCRYDSLLLSHQGSPEDHHATS